MSSSKERPIYLWVFFLIGLLGLLIAYVAIKLVQDDFLGAVGVALGTTLLTSMVIFVLDRSVPRREPKIEILHGHRRIYDEYEKQIARLDDGPHTIRAIASSPNVTEGWDDFLANFLRGHDKVTYSRVVVKDDKNIDWSRRMREIEARYKGILNYEHRVTNGPPSVECLLIDLTHAFITFASGIKPQECTGILIRDGTICAELKQYFANKLEKLPITPLGGHRPNGAAGTGSRHSD